MGLEQASIRNELALDLLEHKQWKEAAVYADASAESYSGWSMVTAARCHELLGDWDKAEHLARAVAERYSNRMYFWLYWCHRTGHGDVHSADEFTRKQVESWGAALLPEQLYHAATCTLLIGQPERALAVFQHAYAEQHHPFMGMHAALLADALGKTALRDALFEQILDTKLPPNLFRGYGTSYYQQMVTQFREVVAPKSSQPKVADFDKFLAVPKKDFNPSVLAYFVGAFFKNRGDLETAKKYLLHCTQANDWEEFNHVLACKLLREMKVKVPPSEDGPKNADPAKPPEGKPKGT